MLFRSEPEEIFEATRRLLCPRQDLKGLKVLVTAGATREMIDPVRYLTNRSTGKMGYAISEAARDRGAEVTLVSGKTDLDKPDHVSRQEVISTQDMYDAVTALAPENDIVIQAAAPADFTPEEYKREKIKKTGNCLTLKLVNTKDIAAAIGQNKQPGQVFVAFAAETDADREKADQKRIRKNADMIVLNDISVPGAGFGTDTNIVTFISDDEITQHPLLTKREVADLIIDKVLDIRRAKGCATQK